MISKSYTEVPARKVEHAEAKGVTIRWLIGEDSPAPGFWMRLFEVQPGGYSPRHQHDWEHEVYVLEGEGEAVSETGPRPIRSGSFVLVMPGEVHQFRNTGKTPLKFLCMIPKSGK
ncbi:MAG TPA: cupin domain-containing protein [Candidatus Aminicenantes bacterium]|nr:cupin domain-containing protein [Candidatus Aminicenantes bacterium]